MTERLSVVDDNSLRYDGKILWADVLPVPYRGERKAEYLPVSPDDLEAILRYGRGLIEATIQSFYISQRTRLEPLGYTIERPSIFTAKLGSDAQTDGKNSKVYSAEGYANGGVHWEVDEQLPVFENHWRAVEKAGFYPHVRGTSSVSKLNRGGAYLMVRDIDER